MTAQLVFSDNTLTNNPVNNTSGLSLETQKLIRRYQEALNPPYEGGAMIYVDEIASKVASLYERVRVIIDWKEEHLIRRTAIERVLKRRTLAELSGLSLVPDLKAGEVAEPLVTELIRGGHFPNGRIPKKRLIDVQRVLQKYGYILENAPLAQNGSPVGIKRRVNFYTWLLEIAACEIDEILGPSPKEDALIAYMTTLILERIRVLPEGTLTPEEKAIQTYIAVHRALFHLDAPIISYHLLQLRYPQWSNLPESLLNEIAKNIASIWGSLERDLNHPLANEFYEVGEKYDTPYLILGDVLSSFEKNPAEIPQQVADAQKLEERSQEAYNKRLSTQKRRLFRMAVYSTLSIFIAGGLSLFIFEVPLAKLVYGEWKPLAMLVDLMLPTALMFILVAIIRLPGESNLKKVLEEIKKIVYHQREIDVYEIQAKKKRSLLFSTISSLLYLLGSFLSLGLIFWVFKLARVPWTSVYIDTLNVAVIVFAALLVRQRAKELVVEEKTRIWEFLLDVLSVPIARVGQWLSNKWKEYNIASVLFTVMVDLPFLTLVDFVENWSTFIKEKKSGIH